MVDPTSDLEEDVDEGDAPACASCGEPIVESSTRRTVTWVEDGRVRHRNFCSEECRDRWTEEG